MCTSDNFDRGIEFKSFFKGERYVLLKNIGRNWPCEMFKEIELYKKSLF